MDDDSTRQSVLFSDLLGRPVVAKFDQQHASSDGGAFLLQACDRRLGLTEALIGGIDDRRQSGKIRHAIADLVRQRLYAIACGYPDGNDASRLGADPIQKLLCGRDPVSGADLASQPTLSRFENAFDRADLYRMGIARADTVIERHRRRLKRKVKRITIDLDPTDDPTHGAQQLTFFNGHYDTWCYLPVGGFLSFNEEAEQYLFAYVLRPGNASAAVGAIGILSRLLPRLRAAFPRARLRVRLDGGFAAATIFAFLEREGLEYVVAMGKNQVLQRRAARLMGTARRRSRETGETAHVYSECRYAAGTWPERRRVIIKAEVVRHPGREPKTIRASWSRTLRTRPDICTKRSTAPEVTSRIGLKSCTTDFRSIAPVARASSPINFGVCSALPPMCSTKSCAGVPRAPSSGLLRSTPCANTS
jgi:hypothetical protein